MSESLNIDDLIANRIDEKEILKVIERDKGIVKNHVFTDGNKRIAATLFIYFLNFYEL